MSDSSTPSQAAAASGSLAVDLDPIKQEILVFMDRSWRVSFGYFAAIAAFLAVSRADFVERLAGSINVSAADLVATVLLFSNAIYLATVLACLFAILKRGLFIILNDPAQSSVYAVWERYLREVDASAIRWRPPAIAWNIDNYYMLPALLLVTAGSAWGAVQAASSETTSVQVVAWVGILAHALPVTLLWFLWRIDSACRTALEVFQADTQPSGTSDSPEASSP
jgi:hypothetical protein